MIIIKALGGLGNQLFQYALYQKFISQGKTVKFDFSQIYENGIENELCIFDQNIVEANSNEISYLGDCNNSILNRIRRKFKIYKKTFFIEKASYTFDKTVLTLDNVYLWGYWQTELYFASISNELKNKIIFPSITEQHNIHYANAIKKTPNPVSIHIRRGDYLSKQFVNQYGNICTDEYYESAIAFIKSKIDNPHFFIFTNDPKWAKEKYVNSSFTVVEGNNGKTSFRDMQLMALCKHNIIANSSFSWWGAWLNNHDNKIVICPKKWCNNKPSPDISLNTWIKI